MNNSKIRQMKHTRVVPPPTDVTCRLKWINQTMNLCDEPIQKIRITKMI